MDYGEVLTRTWRITWKHKALWMLGILAGCSGGGQGGGGQVSGGLRGYQFESGEIPEIGNFFQRIPPGVILALALSLLAIILALVLVLLVVGVIGQGGLIAGFSRADQGMKFTLREAFGWGLENFWKLLGIRLIFLGAGLILGGSAVIGAILFGVLTLGIGLLCLVPLICLLIPLAFAIDAYLILTMIAAVEEDLGVLEAFPRSWQILRQNLGPVIIMALILILGGGIVSAIIAAPFIAVGAPGLIGIILGTRPAVIAGILASVLLLMVALPLAILFSGVLTTFITGAWTLTYRRLIGESGLEPVAAEEQ